MVSLEIDINHAGQRMDKFLGKYLPKAPVSFFYKMLRKKNITLNGKRAEGREQLQIGDQVTLWLAEETILKFGGYVPGQEDIVSHARQIAAQGQNCPTNTEYPVKTDAALYRQAYQALQGITVIYEDTHVLILNKPAGILTQQAKAGDMSLNEWMIGYLLDTGVINSQELRLFRPSVCNRLDRNTSGLVLCGKTLPGSQALSELIRSRAVRKFYRAVCVGIPAAAKTGDLMEIQGYLQKNSRTNQVVINQDGPGDYIRTVYRSLKQYSLSVKDLPAGVPCAFAGKPGNIPEKNRPETLCFTELEVELITGKPHQIRAHLASIGHPLIGDGKYGDTQINQLLKQRFGLRWQLLHAYQLQFPALEGVLAPLSGRGIQAPLPAYYEAILGEMRALSR